MSYWKYGLSHIYFRAINLLIRAPLAFCVAVQPTFVEAALWFNPRFLADDPAAVADLSRFEKGQELPPGIYRVDIYLNDQFIATRDVTFHEGKNPQGLLPCLTLNQLAAMGVDTPAAAPQADRCRDLTDIIREATSRLDVGEQRLYLTVPQAFMGNRARGYIPPSLWDQGITAGLLNYNFSGGSMRSGGSSSSTAYLNVQSGFNAGAWRLRDNTTWRYMRADGAASQSRWQHINSWLERDIAPLRSRLTVGDSYTSGDIFDGINFRGVQLATDDNMLPDSQKGFAPEVRGIARGTAQVTIKQNGYEIYQSTVPPGPFVINDLYAAGNGGDLQVAIKEADGTAQTFTVPWSSVPLLQREGHTRYALTAGEYRSGGGRQKQPTLLQATFLHGLPSGWTLYGGSQFASRYRAFNLGAGKNMGEAGAVSLDITQAQARLADGSRHQGQSVRLLYSKSLNATGTNVQLMGYRYSTRGYYTLADTAWRQMSGYRSEEDEQGLPGERRIADEYNLRFSRRGRLQVNINQQLGSASTLYLSGSHQTYWSTGRADEQLQIGFNSVVEDISWTLSYSLTKTAWQRGRDSLLAFNLNIPFSHWLNSSSHPAWRRASASYSMSRDLHGRVTQLAGLYGTLLEERNLSYSMQTGYARGGAGSRSETGYASLNYRGSSGNANVGYSRGDGAKQLYYGISGGILAHANGVTLSQPLNDTVVLVKAPGAGDVKVENQTGVRTDGRGYAVLPYAMEYRENRVALDTTTLADNVDLDDTVVNVVPTYGAVVRADFNARVGVKMVLKLLHNGRPVPFGAQVTAGSVHSIVADDGEVYLSGMAPADKVEVRWGSGPGGRCEARYALAGSRSRTALARTTAICR